MEVLITAQNSKMIKGSTKVGEIFLCGPETDGKLEVLDQFLGKAITGLGGGCKKMFVLEGKLFSLNFIIS